MEGGDGESQPPPTIHLSITGAYCDGCKVKAEHALAALPQVRRVMFNFASGDCLLIGSTSLPMDAAELCSAVRRLGLQCVPSGQDPLPTAADAVQGSDAGAKEGAEIELAMTCLQMLRQFPREQIVRRYRCGCGCDGCVCSNERILRGDPGREISLGEIADMLETFLVSAGASAAFAAAAAAEEEGEGEEVPIEEAGVYEGTKASQGLRKRRSSSSGVREDESSGAEPLEPLATTPALGGCGPRHTRTPSFLVREWLGLEELLENLRLPCVCHTEIVCTTSSDEVSPGSNVSAMTADSYMSQGGSSSWA